MRIGDTIYLDHNATTPVDAKVQGQFIHLAINTAGEEQIDLLSRAIESDHKSKKAGVLARDVAEMARPDRSADSERLATTLEACWPLHSVVAACLGLSPAEDLARTNAAFSAF